MLDVIDLKRVVLHRAACAVDALRVEATRSDITGTAGPSRCSVLESLLGEGGLLWVKSAPGASSICVSITKAQVLCGTENDFAEFVLKLSSVLE